MNLHKNARTCPKSRALMVNRVLVARRPVAEVAADLGVSPRTVYKWIRRYCECGDNMPNQRPDVSSSYSLSHCSAIFVALLI